jgi:hypothetical protein
MPEIGTEYVRVTDDVKPRREYSIVASAFIEGVHKKVDGDATGPDGVPIAPKHTPEALSRTAPAATAKSDKEAS